MSTNFSLTYDLSYTISGNGETSIIQKGLLTNITDQQFVSSLNLHFDSPSIASISAYDELGPIEPQIVKKDNKTEVSLNFNKNILGIGKNWAFSLSYQNPDIVKSKIDTWEINIPKSDDSPEVIGYNVSVKVPKTFGEPVTVQPPPFKDMNWRKDQIEKVGIKLVYSKSNLSPTIVSPTPSRYLFPLLRFGPSSLIFLILLITVGILVMKLLPKI